MLKPTIEFLAFRFEGCRLTVYESFALEQSHAKGRRLLRAGLTREAHADLSQLAQALLLLFVGSQAVTSQPSKGDYIVQT